MTCPFLCPWEQRVPQLLLALGGLLYLLRPCPPQPQSLRGRASLEWAALQLPLPLGLSWGGQRPLWGPCLCAQRQPPAQGPGPAAARGREQSHVCSVQDARLGQAPGPGSSAHAALPTATLWPLREGRCAAAWWVWIPGSPGGWGTGDSPGQGHAGSRGAVHTGHGPRRPRTWGQGEPRAGPGGS